MRFSLSIAGALALSGASAGPAEHASTRSSLLTRQAQNLNQAMKARGRGYIGTSVTVRNDGQEANIVRSEFGSVTPENEMKWGSLQPNQGQWNWGKADQIAGYAQQNGKLLRCHALVYHDQLPNWVGNGQWNNASLIRVMQTHITTVMQRYRGRCAHWDVVNEALEDDGTYRETVFMDVIGEAYIPLAFAAAAAADPAAKLYYNDYNLEYNEEKTAGAVRIVQLIQKAGAKIHGVGFQGHFVSEETPEAGDLATALAAVADLGVDVVYSEMDVRIKTPATQQKLAKQATEYGYIGASCLMVQRCVGITIWGVSDSHSWVPGVFQGEGAALLWDNGYKKKPAYDAFLKSIRNTPEGVDEEDDTEAGEDAGAAGEADSGAGDDSGDGEADQGGQDQGAGQDQGSGNDSGGSFDDSPPLDSPFTGPRPGGEGAAPPPPGLGGNGGGSNGGNRGGNSGSSSGNNGKNSGNTGKNGGKNSGKNKGKGNGKGKNGNAVVDVGEATS